MTTQAELEAVLVDVLTATGAPFSGDTEAHAAFMVERAEYLRSVYALSGFGSALRAERDAVAARLGVVNPRVLQAIEAALCLAAEQ